MNDNLFTALRLSRCRSFKGDPITGNTSAELRLRIFVKPEGSAQKRPRDAAAEAVVGGGGGCGDAGGQKRAKIAGGIAGAGSGAAGHGDGTGASRLTSSTVEESENSNLQSLKEAADELHRTATEIHNQLEAAAATLAGVESSREDYVPETPLPELFPAMCCLSELLRTIKRNLFDDVKNFLDIGVKVQVLNTAGKAALSQEFEMHFHGKKEILTSVRWSMAGVYGLYTEHAGRQSARAHEVADKAHRDACVLPDYEGPQLPTWAVPTEVDLGPKLVFREPVEISSGVGRGELFLIYFKAKTPSDGAEFQCTDHAERRHRLLFYSVDKNGGGEQHSPSSLETSCSSTGSWLEVLPDQNGFQQGPSAVSNMWTFSPPTDAFSRMTDDEAECNRHEIRELVKEFDERRGRLPPEGAKEIRFLRTSMASPSHFKWNHCQSFIDGIRLQRCSVAKSVPQKSIFCKNNFCYISDVT